MSSGREVRTTVRGLGPTVLAWEWSLWRRGWCCNEREGGEGGEGGGEWVIVLIEVGEELHNIRQIDDYRLSAYWLTGLTAQWN